MTKAQLEAELAAAREEIVALRRLISTVQAMVTIPDPVDDWPARDRLAARRATQISLWLQEGLSIETIEKLFRSHAAPCTYAIKEKTQNNH